MFIWNDRTRLKAAAETSVPIYANVSRQKMSLKFLDITKADTIAEVSEYRLCLERVLVQNEAPFLASTFTVALPTYLSVRPGLRGPNRNAHPSVVYPEARSQS